MVDNLSVDMLNGGAFVTFSNDKKLYQIMASRKILYIAVMKDKKTLEPLITENMTSNPLSPNDDEELMINVTVLSGDKLEESLYRLGCHVAMMHNNNASTEYVERFVVNYFEERGLM